MPKKNIEDMLGEEGTANPAVATPSGKEGEENPLEKMDEISKAKPQKKDTGSKELDDEVITSMFKTGDNTNGMISSEDDGEFEEQDESAKLKVGKEVKPSEKYEKEFKDDMLKHPDEYKVNTPRGEMTVSEALKAGYNPITKRFEKEHDQATIREKHLAGLNDADRAALEQFTNPANAQVAPADAEMYGLQPGSPMIRPEQQPNPSPAMAPGAPAAGAVTPQAATATPLGGALPGSEESMAPGAADLSALLGGGQ